MITSTWALSSPLSANYFGMYIRQPSGTELQRCIVTHPMVACAETQANTTVSADNVGQLTFLPTGSYGCSVPSGSSCPASSIVKAGCCAVCC